MASNGQGAGVYFQPKDKTGGNENLEQTLQIGNTTGANNIDVEQLINFLNSTFQLSLDANTLTANRIVKLQDKDGILALLSDVVAETLQQTLDAGNTSLQNNGSYESIANIIEQSTSFINTQLSNGNTTSIESNIAKVGLALTQATFDYFIKAETNVLTFQQRRISDGKRTNLTVANGVMQMRNDQQSEGIKYAGNYKANITDRHIPDFYAVKSSYIEQFSPTFVNTINNTWQTVSLPNFPLSTTCDILITNTGNNLENGGVRAVGSSLSRIGATQSDSLVMQVLSSNIAQIQIYSTDITKVNFRLIGYKGI